VLPVGHQNFPADYAFLPSLPFTLEGGESYWLVLHQLEANTGNLAWMSNDPTTIPTGSFVTHTGALFSTTSAPGPPSASDVLEEFSLYTLNGTEVPEPATLMLCSVGGMLVLWRLVRRRRWGN
jgi:hypothetical protein